MRKIAANSLLPPYCSWWMSLFRRVHSVLVRVCSKVVHAARVRKHVIVWDSVRIPVDVHAGACNHGGAVGVDRRLI